MVYGIHLVVCLICGKRFTCGDCVDLICEECDKKGKTLASILADEILKTSNEGHKKDEFPNQPLIIKKQLCKNQ